jgi:DNA primase
MSQAGDPPALYNTIELHKSHSRIAVTEGEIDAITATLAGVPAVAVPGASSWQDHFSLCLQGYDEVFVLSDGDQAGREFAKIVLQDVPAAVDRPMPVGRDVSSFVQSTSLHHLYERVMQ